MKHTELDTVISLNETNSSTFQSIFGTTSSQISQGLAIINPLKIFAKPNSEVFFKVQTSLISRYYHEFFPINRNLSDFNLNQQYVYVFSIKFRECIIGEVFNSKINRLY